MSGRSRSRRRRLVPASFVVVAMVATILISAQPAGAAAIGSAGPLTRVQVSPDLNCAVDHTGDTSPEFFGDTACGTLLASGGTLFGPADIPAGDSASPRTAFTAVSQTAVTGSGSGADPYTVVTVVALGTSGLRITETDSYVSGEESYRTDVTVTNVTDAPAAAVLYRAADCYLQNSDFGFGSADPSTGAVSCVAGVDDGLGNIVPGTRIEQWFPLSSGSHYLEDGFNSVWAAIGTQSPLPDLCNQCSNYIDNGAGLSWNLTVPAGGSVTRSHLTVFSPLGRVPLSTTKTADSDTASAGGTVGYTITIHNPNSTGAPLGAITDTLPSGFSYQLGSTTGATTADPSISGQQLSWSGPISIPASGDASIHFTVTVSDTPGDYFNNAGGVAEGFTVAPTGDTARITVTGTGALPGPPADVTATTGDGSAVVSWTPPASDGGSPIDAYTAICTNTTDPGDVHSATVDGSTTSADVTGLTNGAEYTCTVSAHNAVGDGPPSNPSAPFTPSAGEFSATIDTGQGGELDIVPRGADAEGTAVRIVIPPQPGTPTQVVISASLFGHPGEADPTCGGNVCVGQGIQWSVSDPAAIQRMRIVFFEAPRLVHGADPADAVVYKDGTPVSDCRIVGGGATPSSPGPPNALPCVFWRHQTSGGGWWISMRVDGSDPKGRI